MVIKCYKSLYIYIYMCVCIHLIHWNCSPNKAIKLVIAMESDDLVSKSKGFWNKGVWNDLNVFQTFGKQQKVQGWTLPMGYIFFKLESWVCQCTARRPGTFRHEDQGWEHRAKRFWGSSARRAGPGNRGASWVRHAQALIGQHIAELSELSKNARFG